MLSADMGLYYDFTVDKNTGRVSGYGDKRLKENEGKDRPVSCPGLTGRLPKYGDSHLYLIDWIMLERGQLCRAGVVHFSCPLCFLPY